MTMQETYWVTIVQYQVRYFAIKMYRDVSSTRWQIVSWPRQHEKVARNGAEPECPNLAVVSCIQEAVPNGPFIWDATGHYDHLCDRPSKKKTDELGQVDLESPDAFLQPATLQTPGTAYCCLYIAAHLVPK
jgi:hypothetical protein